jgi:DNA helicase-2/ATP-dependent DNA helicase PcrA
MTVEPLEMAHLEYVAERLRLLYVGITRAKRYLTITWSKTSGRQGQVRWPAALAELRSVLARNAEDQP